MKTRIGYELNVATEICVHREFVLMPRIPTLILNNGNAIPQLGFGGRIGPDPDHFNAT